MGPRRKTTVSCTRPPPSLRRRSPFVAGLVLVLSSAASAQAFQLRHTERGDVVAWSLERGTIAVYAESSGLSSEQAALFERAVAGAVDAWNGHSALSLAFTGGLGPASGAIIVRWDTDAWSSNQEQLAIAALAYDERTGAVRSAHVRVNDAYYWTEEGAAGLSAFEGYDLQSTLTHELGHAIGLAHSDVEAATMHLGAKTGQSGKRTLDADDVRGLHALYGDALDPELEAVGCRDLGAPRADLGTTGVVLGVLLMLLAPRAQRRAASTRPR